MAEAKVHIELRSNTIPAVIKCDSCGSTSWELILAATKDDHELLMLRCSNPVCVAKQASDLGVTPEEAIWQILDVTGQFDVEEIKGPDEVAEEKNSSREDEYLN